MSSAAYTEEMQADRCPFCGEPKDAHVFASRTTCVLESEVPDPPQQEDE